MPYLASQPCVFRLCACIEHSICVSVLVNFNVFHLQAPAPTERVYIPLSTSEYPVGQKPVKTVRSTTPTGKARKYKGLTEIVFETDEEHSAASPREISFERRSSISSVDDVVEFP